MITLALLHPLNKTPLQHWTFDSEAVIRIGRSTDNDVVLYSAVVSRYHVELRPTEQGWEITSLGTNGTYLNGKRITQVAAQDGTIIRLARSGPNLQIRLGAEGREAIQAAIANRQRAHATPTTSNNSPLDPYSKTHIAMEESSSPPTSPPKKNPTPADYPLDDASKNSVSG